MLVVHYHFQAKASMATKVVLDSWGIFTLPVTCGSDTEMEHLMCILLFPASRNPQYNLASGSFIIASAEVCLFYAKCSSLHLCCFCCTFSLLPAFAANHPFSSKAWGLFPSSHIASIPVKFYKVQQILRESWKTSSNLFGSDWKRKKGQQEITLYLLLKTADKQKKKKLAIIYKSHFSGNQPRLLMSSVCGNIIPKFLPFHCLWVLLFLLPSRTSCISTNLLSSACSLLTQHLVQALREGGGNEELFAEGITLYHW